MMTESTRSQLFELQQSVEFRIKPEWNEAWQLVDNCWRMDSNQQNESIYSCKLNRPRKPRKNQNGSLWKQRNCPAKMKVLLQSDRVQVEKYGEWDTHNHSIDVMDKLGSCNFIREYIKNESNRGYSCQAIAAAFHNQFDSKGIGARYVTLERIRRYSGISTITTEESIETLMASHYFKTHSYSLHGKKLLVFANSVQLEHLVKYGNKLVLMDACGSLGGFYLVTLVVRDNLRCWIPAGQFWIETEHSDLYVIAFRKLQEWANHLWMPKTFLIDGSNIEAKAIERSFDSIQILRCTRHITQILKAKLAHVEDVLYHMESAVFAESVTDCLHHIDENPQNEITTRIVYFYFKYLQILDAGQCSQFNISELELS